MVGIVEGDLAAFFRVVAEAVQQCLPLGFGREVDSDGFVYYGRSVLRPYRRNSVGNVALAGGDAAFFVAGRKHKNGGQQDCMFYRCFHLSLVYSVKAEVAQGVVCLGGSKF